MEQALFEQQGWVAPPQAVQDPVVEPKGTWQAYSADLQVLPAQHGWPEPPHEAQVPVAEPPAVWQVFPAEQIPAPPAAALVQQGWVAPPQATHFKVEVRQMVFGAVHRLFEQHASPRPPHVPHALSEQVPVKPAPQADSATLHVAVLAPFAGATQHPPARQRLPGQHIWPVPPHALQVCG